MNIMDTLPLQKLLNTIHISNGLSIDFNMQTGHEPKIILLLPKIYLHCKFVDIGDVYAIRKNKPGNSLIETRYKVSVVGVSNTESTV